jgi:Glycosyltransferase family 87
MGRGEPTDEVDCAARETSENSREAIGGAVRRKPISGAGLAYGLTRPSILVLLCAGTVMHLGIAIAQAAARRREWDFSHYYVAALAMRHGLNPYAIDLRPLGRQIGLDGIARATDTPFFLFCFEPLTWFGPAAAFWIWFGINAAALILAMILILRAAPGLDRRQVISLSAIILLYPPLSNHIYFAQTQIVILLLVAVAMRAFEARRDRLAGLALAAAGLLKVFPLVIAGYFIVRRRWRALGWTFAGLAAGMAATIVAFGVERNVSFIAGTYLTRSAGFLARPANVALGSFVSRLFWYAAGSVTMSAWLNWTRMASVAIAELALLGLTIYATMPRAGAGRDASAHDDRESREFALWVVAAIMLSPTAWIHYLVLLILPFMLIAASGWSSSTSARVLWLMVASYAAIGLSMALAGNAQNFLTEHPILKAALDECATLSLLLAFASAWLFASEYRVVNLVRQ